jgi:hypothetical protein
MGAQVSSVRRGQQQLDIAAEGPLFLRDFGSGRTVSRMKKRRCFPRLIAVIAPVLFLGEWPLPDARRFRILDAHQDNLRFWDQPFRQPPPQLTRVSRAK